MAWQPESRQVMKHLPQLTQRSSLITGNFCSFDIQLMSLKQCEPVPRMSFSRGTYSTATDCGFSPSAQKLKLLIYFLRVWLRSVGGLCPFQPFLRRSSRLVRQRAARRPLLRSWMILKSCSCTAEAIWKTEHLPNLAQEMACCALMMPPVAMISAALRCGLLAICVATLRAMGRRKDPQAPPKKVSCLGPTAGQGSRELSGSMKENMVLVAETPTPPALRTESVIWSMMVELGESFTKTGLEKCARTHRTISSTTSGTSEQARPMPFSGMPWLQLRFSSSRSNPAVSESFARSSQSSLWCAAMMEPMMTLCGKSRLSSFAPSTQYFARFSEMSSMLEKEGSRRRMSGVALKMRGATFWISSLSSTKVFVTAKPHPSSKALRIIGQEVAGGAEARPQGLSKCTPAISVEMSTRSISVKKPGRSGFEPQSMPCLAPRCLCRNQLATLPSLTASTRLLVPMMSPPAKMCGFDRDCMVWRSISSLPFASRSRASMAGCVFLDPKALMMKSALMVMRSPVSRYSCPSTRNCSNSMPAATPPSLSTRCGARFEMKLMRSQTEGSKISSLARMSLNPLRKTTVTRSAPTRRAERAQSSAVSPMPSTTTWPLSWQSFSLWRLSFTVSQTLGRKFLELKTLGSRQASLPSSSFGALSPGPTNTASKPYARSDSSVTSLPNSLLQCTCTPSSCTISISHSTSSQLERLAGISRVTSPPEKSCFSKMWTCVQPSLPRKAAQEREAEPAPMRAILAWATRGSSGLRCGSRICFTRIYLKTLQAYSCSLPISMAPPSSQCALQVDAQSSLTGQRPPQERPSGLSERMVLAAPQKFWFWIWQMKERMSMPTEQAFWQGLSAHFMQRAASATASFSVKMRLCESRVQSSLRFVAGVRLKLIRFAERYCSRVWVSITWGRVSCGAVGSTASATSSGNLVRPKRNTDRRI